MSSGTYIQRSKRLTLSQVKGYMAKNIELIEDKIWNITRLYSLLREENRRADVMKEMEKFEKEIVHDMKVSTKIQMIPRKTNGE